LEKNIRASTVPKEALKDVDLIVHAIPVQKTHDFYKSVAEFVPKDVPIVSVSKGIHTDSLEFMIEIIPSCLGRKQPCAFLSGPSFARELMLALPTGIVIAAETEDLAAKVQKYFACHKLRVYTSTDVIGVEVGGALKNIYAIAAGLSEGIGYSYNTASLVVTRGCAEMKKLAVAKGAKENTLAGLSGIGDLMLTCFGPASRNRTVGVRLGKGEQLKYILKSMGEVAEGVPTAAAAVKVAEKYKLDLPLMKSVARCLAGEVKDIMEEIEALMQLPHTPED